MKRIPATVNIGGGGKGEERGKKKCNKPTAAERAFPFNPHQASGRDYKNFGRYMDSIVDENTKDQCVGRKGKKRKEKKKKNSRNKDIMKWRTKGKEAETILFTKL